MDNSPNGFIFLSLGSILTVSSIEPRILDAFVSTFRKLNVNVLMKWENDTFPNKPPNVETRIWFPQPSVLGKEELYLPKRSIALTNCYDSYSSSNLIVVEPDEELVSSA